MRAQAVAAAPRDRRVQADQPAYRGVQPVGRDQVAGRLAVDEQVVAAVLDRAHGAALDRHARGGDGGGQRRVQRRTAHARGRARAGTAPRPRAASPVGVADAR